MRIYRKGLEPALNASAKDPPKRRPQGLQRMLFGGPEEYLKPPNSTGPFETPVFLEQEGQIGLTSLFGEGFWWEVLWFAVVFGVSFGVFLGWFLEDV